MPIGLTVIHPIHLPEFPTLKPDVLYSGEIHPTLIRPTIPTKPYIFRLRWSYRVFEAISRNQVFSFIAEVDGQITDSGDINPEAIEGAILTAYLRFDIYFQEKTKTVTSPLKTLPVIRPEWVRNTAAEILNDMAGK